MSIYGTIDLPDKKIEITAVRHDVMGHIAMFTWDNVDHRCTEGVTIHGKTSDGREVFGKFVIEAPAEDL